MTFQVHFIGGYRDGEVKDYLEPVDAVCAQGGWYAADFQGEASFEWIDDETRKVVLTWHPGWKFEDVDARLV